MPETEYRTAGPCFRIGQGPQVHIEKYQIRREAYVRTAV
jgi:hypothetical protein